MEVVLDDAVAGRVRRDTDHVELILGDGDHEEVVVERSLHACDLVVVVADFPAELRDVGLELAAE